MAKIIQDFWLQQHANKRLHLLGWKGLFVLQKHLQEIYLQVIIFIYYLFSIWVETNFLRLFICGTPAVSLYFWFIIQYSHTLTISLMEKLTLNLNPSSCSFISFSVCDPHSLLTWPAGGEKWITKTLPKSTTKKQIKTEWSF